MQDNLKQLKVHMDTIEKIEEEKFQKLASKMSSALLEELDKMEDEITKKMVSLKEIDTTPKNSGITSTIIIGLSIVSMFTVWSYFLAQHISDESKTLNDLKQNVYKTIDKEKTLLNKFVIKNYNNGIELKPGYQPNIIKLKNGNYGIEFKLKVNK